MIKIGMDEAREMAPTEYGMLLEAAEGTVREMALLREYAHAPPPVLNILSGNAHAAVDVEQDYSARLDAALRTAIRRKIGGTLVVSPDGGKGRISMLRRTVARFQRRRGL